ncbi:hypothetical protein B566_EDAN017336 [Ephemera danica]|nr:hypothetical protein B566_EDAN017336 [Ephemera danica]
MEILHQDYGDIVKLSGLPRKDMVILFNPTDIEKVFRNEGAWPWRPQFESFLYYRTVVRKDFFQGINTVFADQGKKWQEARSHLNPIMMRNVQRYTETVGQVADEFVASDRSNCLGHTTGLLVSRFCTRL